jgi:hypothetical protein
MIALIGRRHDYVEAAQGNVGAGLVPARVLPITQMPGLKTGRDKPCPYRRTPEEGGQGQALPQQAHSGRRRAGTSPAPTSALREGDG